MLHYNIEELAFMQSMKETTTTNDIIREFEEDITNFSRHLNS